MSKMGIKRCEKCQGDFIGPKPYKLCAACFGERPKRKCEKCNSEMPHEHVPLFCENCCREIEELHGNFTAEKFKELQDRVNHIELILYRRFGIKIK